MNSHQYQRYIVIMHGCYAWLLWLWLRSVLYCLQGDTSAATAALDESEAAVAGALSAGNWKEVSCAFGKLLGALKVLGPLTYVQVRALLLSLHGLRWTAQQTSSTEQVRAFSQCS